ncbi:unnamed protein product [Closterium sp. NIES-65]|nr:unnamed protein product [Closterium sp. NIES-65]
MLQSVKKTFAGGRKKQGKSEAASHDAGNAAAAPAAGGGIARSGSGKLASGGGNAGKAGGPHPPPGVANPTAPVRRDPNEVIAQANASPFAEPLPLFRDVGPQEKQALFIRKLHLCTYLFDFNDPMKNVKEKEIKRQTLLELVDYVNSGTGKFNEAVFEDITRMLEINLFRPLPPSAHEMSGSESFDPEEEEPTMEAAWPHLQIVYEFLLRYVVSNETDAKVAKRYVDQKFILKLLNLFDSEDPRERDYLKTILHRIYGKFMVHRPFIRKAINNIFYRFIYESERHNGIAELLEILGSIINGFALPLKEEHKLFLVRALVPLHKPKCVSMYHQQLSYCITQFVEKDPKLADLVLRGLLKFWPLTNSQKEVLFLGELEEILELTQAPEFQMVMTPLFQQIARCLSSSHFQVADTVLVAERTLFLWNNDYIVTLVAQNRTTILPLIFAALERNARSHWNQMVSGLTINVCRMFLKMDRALPNAYCAKLLSLVSLSTSRSLLLPPSPLSSRLSLPPPDGEQPDHQCVQDAVNRLTINVCKMFLAVNGLTINVRKMFLEMDQPLYDECQRQFLEEEGRAADVEELRAATWQRLEEAAVTGGVGGGGFGGGLQGGMDVDSREGRPQDYENNLG